MPLWLQKQHEQQSTNENSRKRNRHLWRFIYCGQVPQLAARAPIHLCAATAVRLWYSDQPLCVDCPTLGDTHLRHGNGFLPLCQQRGRERPNGLYNDTHYAIHYLIALCSSLCGLASANSQRIGLSVS